MLHQAGEPKGKVVDLLTEENGEVLPLLTKALQSCPANSSMPICAVAMASQAYFTDSLSARVAPRSRGMVVRRA